jgi:hypothetical protein
MTYKNRKNNKNTKSRKQIRNVRNTKKTRMKFSNRRTLKYKHGGGDEVEDFKVSTKLDKAFGSDTTSTINTLKQGSQDIETKTGEVASTVAKGVAGLVKTFAYNLPKAGFNMGTDWLAAQVQVYWRFFKNNKIIVFGLFGFREAQSEQDLSNVGKIQLLEGGTQSIINDKLTDFDDYSPPHKEWIYPNFHDKIKTESTANVYVTPIGIGSVFAIKRSKIINFAKSFLPGKTNTPNEIVDIYSPTGYYIVVRITKAADFPAEIHYREIRYNFPEYFIGKKRYVISRIKNTVRLWRQIRVYELNLNKLNDTGTGLDGSATGVVMKKRGGATGDRNGDWEEKLDKKKNRPYWKNLSTNETTWTKPNIQTLSGDESTLGEGSTTGKGLTSGDGSTLGEGSTSGEGSTTEEESTLGEGSTTGKGSTSGDRSTPLSKKKTSSPRKPTTKSADKQMPPPEHRSPKNNESQEQRKSSQRKKSAWEFEWIKINNNNQEVTSEAEKFTQYKNKYTGELVNKDDSKTSNITSDMCNILCYMTNKTDSDVYRDTYCFNNTVIPISNMKNFHKFVIYFRHISNIANWLQDDEGNYYYKYDNNMKNGFTPCHFLPNSTDYFEMQEEGTKKNRFYKDELFGEDGLSCDGQAIMDKFSITDEAFNEYKIRETKRLLALQQYSTSH